MEIKYNLAEAQENPENFQKKVASHESSNYVGVQTEKGKTITSDGTKSERFNKLNEFLLSKKTVFYSLGSTAEVIRETLGITDSEEDKYAINKIFESMLSRSDVKVVLELKKKLDITGKLHVGSHEAEDEVKKCLIDNLKLEYGIYTVRDILSTFELADSFWALGDVRDAFKDAIVEIFKLNYTIESLISRKFKEINDICIEKKLIFQLLIEKIL
jgi:hypothetical protein